MQVGGSRMREWEEILPAQQMRSGDRLHALAQKRKEKLRRMQQEQELAQVG